MKSIHSIKLWWDLKSSKYLTDQGGGSETPNDILSSVVGTVQAAAGQVLYWHSCNAPASFTQVSVIYTFLGEKEKEKERGREWEKIGHYQRIVAIIGVSISSSAVLSILLIRNIFGVLQPPWQTSDVCTCLYMYILIGLKSVQPSINCNHSYSIIATSRTLLVFERKKWKLYSRKGLNSELFSWRNDTDKAQ